MDENLRKAFLKGIKKWAVLGYTGKYWDMYDCDICRMYDVICTGCPLRVRESLLCCGGLYDQYGILVNANKSFRAELKARAIHRLIIRQYKQAKIAK